jgi:phage-related protein
MFAEDPRMYDSTLLSASVPLGATVYVGFGFSLGFSFGFGGVSTTTDQVTFNIGGNRPTPPTFVITGPVTNPRILNDITGAELRFNIVLDVTDTLTIDTKYRTVRLNGTANRRSALVAPNWFFFEPGLNTLRYRAESSSASTLSISYRNAWR